MIYFKKCCIRKIEKKEIVIPRVYPRASAGRSEGPCVSPFAEKCRGKGFSNLRL
jgi:hypothetical protein